MTTSAPVPTTDESAVRAVLDAVYAAWADNDADAFVAPYAVDATAVHSGTVMVRRHRYGDRPQHGCDPVRGAGRAGDPEQDPGRLVAVASIPRSH